MKAPINCPVCGDAMLNVFPPAEDMESSHKLTKYCTSRLNHKITMIVSGDEVTQVSIDLGNGLEAVFLLLLNKIWIQPIKGSKKEGFQVLPGFEPDLTDYKKLVNKVKTYLVFA